MEEILGMIVDAMRNRSAAARGNLAPPPAAPPVGNTAAEIAAAVERANAATIQPSAVTAPAQSRAAAPAPRPAAPRPAVAPSPAEAPRLLAAFGDRAAFLQAFVVSEALAPPVTMRPPNH